MRAAALLVLLAACASEAPPPPEPAACELDQIELLCQDQDHAVARVQDPMTPVPLVIPEQGGQILLLGVRARGADGCSLMMTTSLRDPCTDEVMTLERRPVTLRDVGDGWVEPDPGARSSWANLAVCPNAAAGRDMQGQAYLLRVHVEDADGHTAELSLPVVPTCKPSELGGDLCLCQCQAGYDLGDECPAGLVPGTPAECPAP